MQPRILALALVLAVAPATARADSAHLKPEAQTHLDAALQAYNAKDYDAAIREFGLAYSIDPNPALLYATAQAYRFANKCTEALDFYRRYLAIQQAATCAKAPDKAVCEAQITATNTGISLCENALKQAPRPAEPPPKQTPPPSPPPAASPPPPESPPAAAKLEITAPTESPWYKDPVGDALTVGGVVGVGVGVGFLVMASHSENAAHSATLRSDFLHDLDDATSQRRIGYVALGAGVALAAGGVWVLLHHKAPATQVTATTDGHSITIAGSF
jgi:tetratricopeptide (TPR) repeat protein